MMDGGMVLIAILMTAKMAKLYLWSNIILVDPWIYNKRLYLLDLLAGEHGCIVLLQ